MSRSERCARAGTAWALWLFGAASAWAGPSMAELAQRGEEQRAALMAAIGIPRCTTDAQCWAVPVGARPCGGPETYLPASRAQAEATKVLALAADLSATRRAQQQAEGRVGVCTVLPAPSARCDGASRRCELVVTNAR